MNKPFGITLIGLLIFGGTDPITKRGGYRISFQEAIIKEKCLEDWAKVGAAPLTMKCLESETIWHELTEDNDDDNPLAKVYRAMQAQNDFSIAWLNVNGLSGKHMVAKVSIMKKNRILYSADCPQTRRSDQQQIAKAKSRGQLFTATQGSHFGEQTICSMLPK